MKISVITTALLLQCTLIFGNNLQIGTPVLNASNELVFTVSWDNSWHTNSAPHNWDAVYIFIKYRNCASTNAWDHVSLSTTASDHSVQSPLMIDPYKLSDGKGIIIRRSSPGSGNISGDTVKLKINTPALGSSYDFQVFGIEMVCIPRESFYLGDGTSTYSFTSGATNNPLLITSDNALTRSTTVGNLYCNSSSATVPGSLPAAFPIGFDSMYVMKYEVSQGQYAAFLNTLSSDQANNRFLSINSNRVNMTGTWPNYTTTFPHRAMGYLNWQDLAAYLDWAALRPMTETEFEKICRGPNFPISNEYAWGSNTITDCNTLSNDGTNTEKNTSLPAVGTGIANYDASVILGPVRCGFAGSPTTDRLQSGSSYYGVMEMSGNAGEFCIGVYAADGRNYTGLNGDGYLTGSPTPGFANVTAWPSTGSGYLGVCMKGGTTATTAATLGVSHRSYYNYSTAANRYYYMGGRGIR